MLRWMSWLMSTIRELNVASAMRLGKRSAELPDELVVALVTDLISERAPRPGRRAWLRCQSGCQGTPRSNHRPGPE